MRKRKNLPKNWPADRPVPKYCIWREDNESWVVVAPFARSQHYIGCWSLDQTDKAFECANKINEALKHRPNHPVVWNLLVDISREYDNSIGFHTYPDGTSEADKFYREED